jgi:hypothetical protein
MSLWLPPASRIGRGTPAPSVTMWCLEPALARSTGLGPVLGRLSLLVRGSCRSPPATSPAVRPPATRPATARVAAPRPGLVPGDQPPPACHPGAEAQLCGRNSHGIAVYSTNKIPHSTCRSGNRRRPRISVPALDSGQQRLDPLPPLVRDDPRRLFAPAHGRRSYRPSTVDGQPNPRSFC